MNLTFIQIQPAKWCKFTPAKLAKLPSFRLKAIAESVVKAARMRGNLPVGRESICCSCGADRAHAHHEDYSQPYRVVLLCASCHRLRHVELGWGGRKAGLRSRIKTLPTCISLPPDLAERVMLRVMQLGTTRSGYFQRLAKKDLRTSSKEDSRS